MRIGRLLFPALRWDDDRGFDSYRDTIDAALEHGVGGFILFGGDAATVRGLVAELRERSDQPLLIGADLERGAGQQFRGATPLPPVAALGALDDLDVTRRAGRLTAREAVALGVNWVYAPVADLNIEPDNPIVGTRAFGGDVERVARHVSAWVEGCHAGGALSCVKHFPGHGRTVSDSHLELPHVDAGRDALDRDLVPFRAGIRAGADSMMTAHVAYPGLDESGAPATLSPRIVTGMLRDTLGFTGLVVTDALTMEGVLEGGSGEGEAAVRALAAGCDALLYPHDFEAVLRAVDAAIGDGLSADTVRAAIQRIDEAAVHAPRASEAGWGAEEDRTWAREVAERSLRSVRGEPERAAGAVDVVTIDDDVGGPYAPPARDAFPATLREAGCEVRESDRARPDRPAIVALYADIRAWKGRPGVSADARTAVERSLEARPDATVVLFGPPRLADAVPGETVLAAWGGEPLMQEAAARRLVRGGGVA